MAKLDTAFELSGCDYLNDDRGALPDAASRSAVKPKRESAPHGPLFFDLETVPDTARLADFDLPAVTEPPEESLVEQLPQIDQLLTGTVEAIKSTLRKFVAPDAWLGQLAAAERSGKSRSGVQGAIDESRQLRQIALNAQRERIKLLSTTPEYCAIAALGWRVSTGTIESLVVGSDREDGEGVVTELEILDLFWSLAAQASPLIGYHILSFDLPVIFARSVLLGVPATRLFDLKPWGGDVLDLYAVRFPRGSGDKLRPGKLKSLAKAYGIDVPADEMDGSCVHELMAADTNEARDRVGEYVRSDVQITSELYRRLRGYFWA